MIWKFPKYDTSKELNWDDLLKSYSWILDMSGVPQDPIWHAEWDVLIHTQMVLKALFQLEEFQKLDEQEKHILVTAALFHDIEKRSTTTEEEIDWKIRIVSPKHAKKWEYTTRFILYKEFNTSFVIREQICKLVRLHRLPVWWISKKCPELEAIYASTVVDTKLLIILAKADIIGRECEAKKDILLRIELFKELCIENWCYGVQKKFQSNHGRYLYLSWVSSYIDYRPFDDFWSNVIVMCALPWAWKDTYISNHFDFPVLSLDDIRREYKINPSNKKDKGKVIQLAKEKAKSFLREKQSFIFNATNITVDMRKKWIDIFIDYKAMVKIVHIEVPYSQLKKQNKNRDHSVPESVLEWLILKYEVPSLKEAHELESIIIAPPF